MKERYDVEEDTGMSRIEHIEEQNSNKKLLYGVEDNPSPGLCFLFGLQHAVMTIAGVISLPFILCNLLCARNRPDVISPLMSISIFMSGIATVIQATFGVRLGMIQGGSYMFVPAIFAMMSNEKWQCDPSGGVNSGNTTGIDPDAWKDPMREIQGSLILASLTQVLFGCTGLLGFLMQFIGPLTIAPTLTLIGLSLGSVAIDFNVVHWGVAVFAMVGILVFGLYLGNVKIPLPSRSAGKCQTKGFPLFQLFPIIFSIGLSWLLCLILTATDTIPDDPSHPNYFTRTDSRTNAVSDAPWFYWPYPFQFGVPTVSTSGYVGFLAATLASIIESLGDYYAAAGISAATPPPAHAVNRGIAIEGFGSVISGMIGAGQGTTSYSGNIGVIGITKVASRSVFIMAGVILTVCGLIGKLGAVLSLIPDPVVGGTLTILFGMVSAVGISTLKFVDMNSTRNLTIIGVSLLIGLMVPQYINDPKNADAIKTGNEELDQVIKVLGGTAIFVGGSIGFILDNTVPGTDEERGIYKWRQTDENSVYETGSEIYDFPYIMKYIRRVKCLSYIPVCPTFKFELKSLPCCRRKRATELKNDHSQFSKADIEMSASNGGYDNPGILKE